MMMNQNTNNEQAITALIQAITALTQAITALTQAITADATTTEATATTAETTTTAAETTTTTEATEATTAPIIVLDDDDSVIGVGFKGSMIEQDPCDPMPSDPTATETAEAADEANADTAAEETLDNIICDISTLYDIAEYTLCHEGKNIESDKSPYAPKENKMGVIGDYQVFIAKEVIKDCDHVTGSFRLVVKDRLIVNPIMELELRLIDNHFKVFSSENTYRMEKLKESHEIMRFLELVDEVSSLVMSKYISD